MTVYLRDPTGTGHMLADRPSTILAETLRVGPHACSCDAARSAADKIELRLVGADDAPVEFEGDEVIEVLESLTTIVVGFDAPETRALYAGFTH